MDELIHRILTRLRGMWHRRWIGLAAAWIAAIVGVSVALRIPDRYEASARVYVDTQTLLRRPLWAPALQPASPSRSPTNGESGTALARAAGAPEQ